MKPRKHLADRRRPPTCAPLLLAALAGCGGSAEERDEALPLSGVLITLDTTNAGALDIYGKDHDLTPNLEALAAESVVFDRAYSVAPITLPSHTSMLTGLYPLRHGVRENGMMKLSQEAETLAERAQEAGFATAAFVSASVLLNDYGLDQGFDVYDQPARESRMSTVAISENSSAQVTDKALAWLKRRDAQRPFFLWVHYFDPHMPYTPPPELVAKAGGNLYRAEIAGMDRDIGRLVDGLAAEVGLDALTLAVVADHGEAFQSHGEPTHSLFCYDATIQVPFLVRFPDGRRAGTRSAEVVSVVDVFPTFLDELGLAPAADVDGLSLAGAELPADRGVYMESYSGYLTYGWSPIAGWTDAGGKYLHSSAPEFYDLARDPKESNNLFGRGAFDASPYLRAIEALARRPRLATGGDVELSAERIRELNALGYAAAGHASKAMPEPLEPTGLPAPTEKVELYAKSAFATGVVGAGQYEEAIPLLREILVESPNDINALENLGFSLVSTGRYEEAIEPLRKALARGAEHHLTLVSLGLSYEQTGQLDKSLVAYQRAERLLPGGRGIAEAIARVEARLAE